MEEDYYLSNESEDVNHKCNMEDESDEESQQREIYITRSGRTLKPPDRLTYDAQACLLTQEEHKVKNLG
jgi:hypothetical protein